MIIYFLRHASAGQSKSNAKADAKRPLDKEGIVQCGEIGRVLAAMDTQVDAIISSPLKRATQTASLVGNEIGFDGELIFSEVLATGGTFQGFRQLLDKHSRQDAIMVVGHNPSLSQFLSLLLTGGTTDKSISLKKASVARVEMNARQSSVLNWCLTPRLVEAIQDSTATKSRPKTSRK
jgi:phosphohistidine phosphatase